MHESAVRTSTDLMRQVKADLDASGLLGNRYFQFLQSGEMSFETFRCSQQQFYFAVEYFSRPMSALMMRMPHGDTRLGILENIVEEHGGFHLESFHEATFRKFLVSLGDSGEKPDVKSMQPAVHAFNATIMSACLSDDVCTGIACLGVIEYAFADISSLIGRAVVQRDWVPESELVHYNLHEEIDKQHAADFFRLLEIDWETDRSRLQIRQGIRLGVYAFDRLYCDLVEC